MYLRRMMRRVGRKRRTYWALRERYWRAGGAFEMAIAPLETPEGKTRLSITWKRNGRWGEWAAVSEGCYLLRTNLVETDPAVLWKRHLQLTEAEWAFRIAKDELAIRPVWHHGADRVKGHILVCFLAFAMWKTLAQWMRAGGLGDAPRPLVEDLARVKSGDVLLPTRDPDGRPGRTLRVRCVTAPDEFQRVLLSRLGLALPERLRWQEDIPPADYPRSERQM